MFLVAGTIVSPYTFGGLSNVAKQVVRGEHETCQHGGLHE